MAAKETIAITNAVTGNKGYMGTLNGRSNSGSFFLSCNNAIIEMMYKVKAPNTEIVIISDVLPVNKATMPMSIFINNALDGV